jgi:hypothetical protein
MRLATRRTARIIVTLLAVLVAAGLLGIAGYVWACGTERWLVKTGADVDASQVDLSNPYPTSVSEMNTFSRPSTIPRNNRADWVELTMFQLTATLTIYKRELDEDYHLVLQDDDGSEMIVEIPAPDCVDPSSPFADYIANARAEFDATPFEAQFCAAVSRPAHRRDLRSL